MRAVVATLGTRAAMRDGLIVATTVDAKTRNGGAGRFTTKTVATAHMTVDATPDAATAITAITVQNTLGVTGIHAVPEQIIADHGQRFRKREFRLSSRVLASSRAHPRQLGR